MIRLPPQDREVPNYGEAMSPVEFEAEKRDHTTLIGLLNSNSDVVAAPTANAVVVEHAEPLRPGPSAADHVAPSHEERVDAAKDENFSLKIAGFAGLVFLTGLFALRSRKASVPARRDQVDTVITGG